MRCDGCCGGPTMYARSVFRLPKMEARTVHSPKATRQRPTAAAAPARRIVRGLGRGGGAARCRVPGARSLVPTRFRRCVVGACALNVRLVVDSWGCVPGWPGWLAGSRGRACTCLWANLRVTDDVGCAVVHRVLCVLPVLCSAVVWYACWALGTVTDCSCMLAR